MVELFSHFAVLPCKIRTGILVGSRRNLGGIPARFWPPGFFFLAGISPGSEIPGGFLPRSSPRFSAAKISPESYRKSRQEANSQWQKFSVRSCWKSRPRLATGSEILGEIHCGNLITNFFWIEPNVYGLK